LFSPCGGFSPIFSPESVGLAPAVTTLLLCFICITAVALMPQIESHLPNLLLCLIYLTGQTFIGFADDVLDLRWRHKLLFGLFCAAPLPALCPRGATVLPASLAASDSGFAFVNSLSPLLPVAYVAIAIFAPNAINIHAGINGLEVSQSTAIAVGLAILAGVRLAASFTAPDLLRPLPPQIAAVALLCIFFFATRPLAALNRYPARVFVGDTFTNFAGAALVSAALLLQAPLYLGFLMLPQIFNFLLSLPQLLGFLPCPRHRLPRLGEDGRLHAVWPQHLTLINFWLGAAGPLTELQLTKQMGAFHLAWSVSVASVALKFFY
jgi:UDP-N-acetylglucosamine--dolichyl-phosphate N-acetylglucosaminephosphotransferase